MQGVDVSGGDLILHPDWGVDRIILSRRGGGLNYLVPEEGVEFSTPIIVTVRDMAFSILLFNGEQCTEPGILHGLA